MAAAVLAGRGFGEVEAARAFLEVDPCVPSPFLFGHMKLAVERIEVAIAEGRRVVVHGDYDADGVTATALMVEGLAELGLSAEWYLPSRFKEGYGLSRAAVEAISAEGPGNIGRASSANSLACRPRMPSFSRSNSFFTVSFWLKK